MSDETMVALVQRALDDRGVKDEVVAVGEFNPRGHSGGLFVGGLAGGEVGGVLGVGEAAGAGRRLLGWDACRRCRVRTTRRRCSIGVSSTAVYGFAARTRHDEPTDLVLRSAPLRAHGERPQAGERPRPRADRRCLRLQDRARGQPATGDAFEGRDRSPRRLRDLLRGLAGGVSIEWGSEPRRERVEAILHVIEPRIDPVEPRIEPERDVPGARRCETPSHRASYPGAPLRRRSGCSVRPSASRANRSERRDRRASRATSRRASPIAVQAAASISTRG